MSTRCQMAVYESKNAKIEDADAFIYRHSDGYPDGVLPDIQPFLDHFQKTRGISDREYCAARLVQYLCNRYDDGTLSDEDKALGGTLGHGIGSMLHGDIEFFYHISPQEIGVYEVDGDDPAAWKKVKTVKIKSPVKS